jgi:hypothetical protein
MRLAFLAVLCVPLLLMVGWNWYTREAIAWDYTGLPERIHYCDRDYQPGSHLARVEIKDQPLQQVGKSATGRPMLARTLSDGERRAMGYPLLPCTMVVYLQVGADDYIVYGLMGGP